MNLFQLIVTPLAALFFVGCVLRFVRSTPRRRVWLLAALTWLLIGVFVTRPDLTMVVAKYLGIGRGADLVLYVVVIAFICSFFYFYGKVQSMESQITGLVRHIALAHAETPKRVRSSGASGQAEA